LVKNIAVTTGRRKTAVARVFLRAGKGNITVNGKKLEDYFPFSIHSIIIKQPLEVTDSIDKFDFLITVKGGASPDRLKPAVMLFPVLWWRMMSQIVLLCGLMGS